MVKNLSVNAGVTGDVGSILGWERSVFLPGESHGQELGRLQSIGSQRVRHDYVN